MNILSFARYFVGGFAAATIMTGCGVLQQGHGESLPLTNAPAVRGASATSPFAQRSKIEHIVVIIQEGRSFNNLFYGYPGAKTASYGYDSRDHKIALKPIGLATTWGIEPNFVAACNGTGKVPGTDCRMNGFDHEHWSCTKTGASRCPIKYPAYSYVPHNETKPYFDIAHQYVVADETYASNFDGSAFVAHQYLIAGQAAGTIGYPQSNWGCPGGRQDKIWSIDRVRGMRKLIPACFDYQTLGDELDAAGNAWAFYANPLGLPGPGRRACGKATGRGDAYLTTGIWSAYQAVKHICYGSDWDRDVISPPKQFLSDVKRGDLSAVTWITPTCDASDLAGCDAAKGPSWVASLVNAIGESKFWNSSAIFVVWDSFGGWYDAAPPSYVDYDGLGIRVPLLIVSPYAKKDYVSHTHYEFGSILKFAEDTFGLKSLAASDRRANSPTDAFDFGKPPRTFVPIKKPAN